MMMIHFGDGADSFYFYLFIYLMILTRIQVRKLVDKRFSNEKEE